MLEAMINDGGRLVVLGRGEPLSALPEFRASAATRPSWDDARYVDYIDNVMVVPVENIIGLPGDPLGAASSVVRMMGRADYALGGLREVDAGRDQRPNNLRQQYELRLQRLDVRLHDPLLLLSKLAAKSGLWRGTAATTDLAAYRSAGVRTTSAQPDLALPPRV